jgi:hypothetical protein
MHPFSSVSGYSLTRRNGTQIDFVSRMASVRTNVFVDYWVTYTKPLIVLGDLVY